MAFETYAEIKGSKQFKDELKNMRQAGKTLSAEMGVLAASFKNSDDKEKALSDASKKLSEQIKNQKDIIDKLSHAVSIATAEGKENETQALQWKEQIAKAEKKLAELEGTTAESAVGMKDLAEAEGDAGKEADGAGGKVSAFTIALGNLMADAIKEGFRFMVDSLKKIGQYLIDATKGAAAYADEITTMSKQTSMSTQALQEYKYMAALTDTDLNVITGSLTKLTKNMDSAKGGTGAAAEAFKTLGVDVTDSNEQLRDTNAVFDEAITALGQIQNETERDALAMQIFGKSAKDLNPMIEAGGDALAEFRQEASDVGYVLDEETLDKLGEVQDGFDRLGLAADSAKNQIGASIGQFILPYLNELVGAVQDLVGGGDVESFVDRISGVLTGLVSAIAQALPTVLQAGGEIVGQLIMGINEMLPTLVPAAVGLVSQFATFIIQNLPAIINTAVEIIIALANGLAEQLPTLIPAAIQMIMTIVEGLVSNIGDIISAALNLIQGIVEGLTSPEAINAIIDAIPMIIEGLITGILNNLGQIIASSVNIIVALVMGLIRAIPKLIAKIIRAIVDAFKNFDWSSLGGDIMGNLSDGVKNAATTIWNAVKDAFDTAVNWIKDLGSRAWTWGKDMIQGFVNGVKEKAQKLIDGVKNIAEKIKGFLHFSRPDEGPLRDYETWMPDFMQGLARGIDSNAWRVRDALKNATGGMKLVGEFGAQTPAGGAGSQTTQNFGGVTINVHAAPGQNEQQIAKQVIKELNNQVNARRAVFA